MKFELEKNEDMFYYTVSLYSLKSPVKFYAYSPLNPNEYKPYILVENRYVKDKNTKLSVFGLTIDNNPIIIGNTKIKIDDENLDVIKDFIRKNKKNLLSYWFDEIDDEILLNSDDMIWN